MELFVGIVIGAVVTLFIVVGTIAWVFKNWNPVYR